MRSDLRDSQFLSGGGQIPPPSVVRLHLYQQRRPRPCAQLGRRRLISFGIESKRGSPLNGSVVNVKSSSKPTTYLEMNEEIYCRAFLLIGYMCYLMCGSLLVKLRMPAPNHLVIQMNVPLLNPQQKEVYDTLMKAIVDENDGLYFLDAPGGSDKTFLMSVVLVTVRVRSNITVAVASSRIAATLLEGCCTAHSALKLPLTLQAIEERTLHNGLTSAKAHKRTLEALNRTLKDLRNDSRCFGGAMILLSGDFRQTLPHYVKKLQLTKNMRIALLNVTASEDFSEQLLTIATNFPIEFLNSLDVPGLLPHSLRLKISSIVGNHAPKHKPTKTVQRNAFGGKFEGEEGLIPRIPMIPTNMPFEFKRLQFSIRLAFAMTKSQSEFLKVAEQRLSSQPVSDS
ncbi:ATP-dependent DNA helicase PIF1-like [Aphis craccivora]|uniref:ATP-dependent DNA helicase n=1 Tax=Aphis craccivora TaxID=307492 RepID=A0A6G0ZFQ5_APHCR|nr:ATP-dependent DNA helicase PIF1-like [Aphis craccivora]